MESDSHTPQEKEQRDSPGKDGLVASHSTQGTAVSRFVSRPVRTAYVIDTELIGVTWPSRSMVELRGAQLDIFARIAATELVVDR